MDNFTHVLVGLVLADAVCLALPAPPSVRARGLLRFASAFANNVPDFDFLYARLTPGKLGYLLHHRGHTHTLLSGIILGALTYVALVAWARRRSLALSRPETAWLAALCLFGPWTHVAMDALNSYGVHPFWPAHDGWLYGDAIFIIEPWFWVLSIPPLALASATRWGRILLGVFLAGALVSAWAMPIVGWGTALALTLGSALAVFVSGRLRERGRVLFALGGFLAVIAVFAVASREARATLLDAMDAQPSAYGKVTIVDVALTPLPGNPVCWQGVVVGRRHDAYVLEVARVSLLPGPQVSWACRTGRAGVSLGMRTSSRRYTRDVLFQTEHQAPLAAIRELARSNCQVGAFLRFARAPFWIERGASLYLGDLRFDRDGDAGFTELEVPARPSSCPPWLPPWTPPRHDLLE